MLGEHGRGGLGKVSRAHDLELGRDVAIKELLSRNALHEVRFMREVLITARLEHPGIVPVHEAGRWPDGTPFYAMKLVAGRPLVDLLAERKTVDERIGLLHHVIAVADAIAYAHRRNIIHRDLKPGNVIVGDFGETVVIDWGLAKDLSASDDPPASIANHRVDRNDTLTSAGAVMGTPAYMAPEQRRGDLVDQRADVYAIGALLWELCSLRKLPPSDSRERQRVLRRDGIDPDLVAIIDKALQPDPDRRYPDAGALAADLKAFKSGARIDARRYSLGALLAHWTRRHRRLAWSIATLLVLAVATMILYIRRIAEERDRADRSELVAKRARAAAEASLGQLTLKHAELQLQTDPTASVLSLADYRGNDVMRRMQLLAEATGRGVARQVFSPHFDTIHFLVGLPDGSIVSASEDGRVRRTTADGSTTLGANVSHVVQLTYSRARRLLAYATSQRTVAVMDLGNGSTQTLNIATPVSLSFADDGSHLAALDKRGLLTIWSMATPPTLRHRQVFATAQKVSFIQRERLAVLGQTSIQLIDLDGEHAISLAVKATLIQSDGHDLLAATDDGELLLLSTDGALIAKHQVCRTGVTAAQFVPHRDLLVFGCHEGGVGIVSHTPGTKTLSTMYTFPTTDDVSALSVDDAGQYLLASSHSTAYLHYLDHRLTTRLQGQSARIAALAAGTADFPHLLTGDVHGSMRVWSLGQPRAHMLARVQGISFGAEFSPDGASLAVYGSAPDVHVIRMADGAITELSGHTDMLRGVRYSPSGATLMSFSWDGTARTWEPRRRSASSVFRGHDALVQQGDFIDHERRAVTAGDDGHVFAWDPGSGSATAIFAHERPLIDLHVLHGTDTILVQDSQGSLWTVTARGEISRLHNPHDSEITILCSSNDGHLVATGEDSGTVIVYRTSDWQIVKTFKVKGSIGALAFHPHNETLLTLSEDGLVTITALKDQLEIPWTTLQVAAHKIAYTPDGSTIAIGTFTGGSWFYSMQGRSWHYVHDHDTEVRWAGFSPDGSTYVSIDRDGIVIARDIASTLSMPSTSLEPINPKTP